MSAIIPFSDGAKLPAYLRNADKKAAAAVNADVVTGTAFPNISIKGKVFTQVREGVREIMRNPQDPDEVAQSIEVTVLRANMKARVFYAKRFVEDDAEGTRPTCFTHDGVAPSPEAAEPQAKKCQLCPHAAWGSKVLEDGTTSRGTACASNARLAIAAPDKLDDTFLLRVPPASLKNFKEVVKIGQARNIPYNALVIKLGFDAEAASPKLTFRARGLLSDEAYAQVTELYNSEKVEAIVGVRPVEEEFETAAKPEPADVGEADLDAAIAAKAVTAKAKTSAAGKPAKVEVDEEDLDAVMAKPPAPAPAPAKPVKATKPPPKAEEADADAGELLAGLDNMLSNLDD